MQHVFNRNYNQNQSSKCFGFLRTPLKLVQTNHIRIFVLSGIPSFHSMRLAGFLLRGLGRTLTLSWRSCLRFRGGTGAGRGIWPYKTAGLSLRFQVVVSSRGSRKQSWSPFPPPLPQEGFEVQLLPFSKRHYRPKKAIFIKSTAIISGFMMITSLLKKTTTFWDTKIIVKLLYVKARWRVFLVAAKWEYTCKHRA